LAPLLPLFVRKSIPCLLQPLIQQALNSLSTATQVLHRLSASGDSGKSFPSKDVSLSRLQVPILIAISLLGFCTIGSR
ncbi:hypothetical protein, partial [Microcoleus sp. N9_A1]|uniref:hypothetical protein n=1 Tax=Microcoleus sp. N9_A1 TaxID=3055380 RepID=UPI002FD25D50